MTGETMTRATAEAIIGSTGWLASQPAAFRTEVLRRAVLVRFRAGEVIFRIGDDLGGIYGLVSGTVTVMTGPEAHPSKLVHIGSVGAWTGEGCFLTRQRRRLELSARVDTWLMHLPLDQMDQMAFASPQVIRNFSVILMATVDELVQIVHDLQKLDPDRRIASVLCRMTSNSSSSIPITQTEIGEMACASRRQVNAVLNRFARRNWIRLGYRSLAILDLEAMRKASAELD